MLSDHERERMRALERPFRAEDQEFTRSFAMRARHLRREHGDGASLTIGIVAAVLLGALLQRAQGVGKVRGCPPDLGRSTQAKRGRGAMTVSYGRR